MDITPTDNDSPLLTVLETGRDLLTDWQGRSRVLAEASIRTTVDYQSHGKEILELEMTPEAVWATTLIGKSLLGGFRRATADAGGPSGKGSLISLLLSELPIAVLISGAHHLRDVRGASVATVPLEGTCSGWVAGGELSQRARNRLPLSRRGPAAPSAHSEDDPLAWHAVQPTSRHQVRRRRRIDLRAPSIPGHPFEIDAMFRDTYTEDDLQETVIHEYSLRGEIDPVRHVLLSLSAQPHVLPAHECPLAADFVDRLVGSPLEAVRPLVSRALRGVESCTHLNDALRSIGDISCHELVSALGQSQEVM